MYSWNIYAAKSSWGEILLKWMIFFSIRINLWMEKFETINNSDLSIVTITQLNFKLIIKLYQVCFFGATVALNLTSNKLYKYWKRVWVHHHLLVMLIFIIIETNSIDKHNSDILYWQCFHILHITMLQIFSFVRFNQISSW